ncbi:MAG: 50S ribosomal protein L29 [Verrucomicrobiota bacterium]
MKAETLREQSDEELFGVLEQLGNELFDLRLKNKMGDTSIQPLKIRQIRKDIARVKTVLRDRKSGMEPQ